MKQILIIVVALIIGVATINTTDAKTKTTFERVEIKTDIDCPSCEKKIMNVLPFQRGIKSVDIDLKSGVVTVLYNPKSSSVESIKSTLNRLDVKCIADPRSQK